MYDNHIRILNTMTEKTISVKYGDSIALLAQTSNAYINTIVYIVYAI